MPDFTPTQGRYLSFIHAYTEATGQPPSMQDIADALKVSTPSVNGMFKTLEKKKLVERQIGVARSIEVLIDPSKIPPWKNAIKLSFEIWAPKDVSDQWLDQRSNDIIQRRKADRLRTKREAVVKDRLQPSTVFRFKVTLTDSQPLIWRRFEMTDGPLGQLHDNLQLAMGWTNSHLHEFQIANQRFTDPGFLDAAFDDFGAQDYSEITVSQLVGEFGPKLKFSYLYDFGDGWDHKVVLESIGTLDPCLTYPVCVDGKMACPPEDVGGVWGYQEFLIAMNDPDHEMHEQYIEWNEGFDPNKFDLQQTSMVMRNGLPI